MAQTVQQIEEEMEEIRMLMGYWNEFYSILIKTFFDKEADIKALDKEFQKIKGIVAEHHGHFMKVIKKDYHIGQSILTTVKRTISLEGFMGLSDLEIRKTLIEWHDANILLNETLGSLECERDKILRGIEVKVHKTPTSEKLANFFSSGTFKTIINLVIFVAVLGVLAFFWEDIVQSQIYQDYLASFLNPIFDMVGIPTGAEEAATNGNGA